MGMPTPPARKLPISGELNNTDTAYWDDDHPLAVRPHTDNFQGSLP
jgi:hypothetical protein